MTISDATSDQVVQAVAAAAEDFINGEPDLFKQQWSHSLDVMIFGGYGAHEHGRSEVDHRLDRAWARFRTGGTLTYRLLAAGTSGDHRVRARRRSRTCRSRHRRPDRSPYDKSPYDKKRSGAPIRHAGTLGTPGRKSFVCVRTSSVKLLDARSIADAVPIVQR